MAREGRGSREKSLVLSFAAAAGVLLGFIITLSGAAIVLLTGLGILKFQGPATKIEAALDKFGIQIGVALTQIGVGVLLCVIGAAILAWTYKVFTRPDTSRVLHRRL